MGVRGTASGNFTVSPNGTYTGTITITPSGGGLSTPIVKTFSASPTGQTFTITPTVRGVVTLTCVASPALGTNPLPLSFQSLPKVKITFKGDSLTLGSNASSGQSTTTGPVYPGVVMTALQGASSFYGSINLGVGSQRLDTMLGNAASEMLPQFDSAYDLNIASIMACSNDIGGTDDLTHNGARSAATCYADLITYCNILKSYGFYVVVGTIPPAGFSGWITNFNTVRDQYNELVRNGWRGFAHALFDYAQDSRIGWDGREFIATYYEQGASVHFTDSGS